MKEIRKFNSKYVLIILHVTQSFIKSRIKYKKIRKVIIIKKFNIDHFKDCSEIYKIRLVQVVISQEKFLITSLQSYMHNRIELFLFLPKLRIISKKYLVLNKMIKNSIKIFLLYALIKIKAHQYLKEVSFKIKNKEKIVVYSICYFQEIIKSKNQIQNNHNFKQNKIAKMLIKNKQRIQLILIKVAINMKNGRPETQAQILTI